MTSDLHPRCICGHAHETDEGFPTQVCMLVECRCIDYEPVDPLVLCACRMERHGASQACSCNTTRCTVCGEPVSVPPAYSGRPAQHATCNRTVDP